MQAGDAAAAGGIAFRHAESDAEISACFPLMAALRPHLASAAELVTRIARQRAAGYRVLAAWRAAAPVGLAGYRMSENLIYGAFVYVDDLVTAEAERGGGIGAQLLDGVADEGRRHGCRLLVLDTGLGNVLAHRFYYRQGLVARALHFSRDIAV